MATHAASVEARIIAMINDESARQKLEPAPNLYHAMIMFISGIIARRVLANAGVPDYVPYASRHNQLTHVERSAFERRAALLGRKVSFDQALYDLVRDAR